jgi:signal transduction histidine kinase/CheY-like chemotaxis protein
MSDDDLNNFRKMATIAQIGWWKSDIYTRQYECSDYIGQLLGLKDNKCLFSDFLQLVRSDYRELLQQEFYEYSSYENNYYERVFPVITPDGEIWLKAHLGDHYESDGKKGSFGVMMVVPSPEAQKPQTSVDINNLLMQQSSISHFLTDFLQNKNEKEIIDNILAVILKVFGMDRIRIFEYSDDLTYIYCKYEINQSALPDTPSDSTILSKDIPWWNKQILAGKPIILSMLSQIPFDVANEFNILHSDGIKSTISIPMMHKDGVWGYLSIDSIKDYHTWRNEDYQWLSSICNIISISMALNKTIDDNDYEHQSLENLIKYMPVGYLHVSVIRNEKGERSNVHIIKANSFYAKIYGKESEYFVGKLGSDFLNAEDLDEKLSFCKELPAHSDFIETDEQKPNGRYYHEIIYSPEEDEVVSLLIDNTAMHNASQALMRSEKLFKDIFTNIPVAVGIYSPEGKAMNLNAKFLETFGLTSMEDVKDYLFFSDIHATDEIKRQIKEEDQCEFNLTYSFDEKRAFNTRREGSINLYVKITKLFDEAHNCFGYLLICLEDSDYFIAMNRVRDFENLFSIISDYSKVGYAKVNIVTGEGFAVKQWYRNMGEKDDTPIPKILGIYNGVHPEDKKMILQFLAKAKKGLAKDFRCEVRTRDIDAPGRWRWIYKNLVITKYAPDNNEIELIGVNYDITELKEVEEELSRARDKAETMDRLKSAFLANMSHEIRTPLNAIVGFSDILTETDSREDRKEYAKIIHENNTVLLQLISDILDLSKIEAGTFDFVGSEVSARGLCTDLMRSTQLKLKDGVSLAFDSNCPDYYVYSDHNRLYQILSNFMSNAIKFTNKGTITLSYEQKGNELIFSVSDTGIGIDEEKLSHIFERFYKVNSFIPGTGLGLPICQSIIEQLGGRLGVQSTAGVGSRFWFAIPYDNASKKEIKKEMEDKLAVSPETLPLIMVTEDMDTNYSLIYTILHEDYRLIWARDGSEAVELCREQHPDLILMDIKMPNMDGYEATTQIRKFDADVPIIAITAYVFEEDRHKALDCGCTDYVTKPITGRALKDKIEVFLRTKKKERD